MIDSFANTVISINELWSFYNLSDSLFVILDPEGKIKNANPSFSKLLGLAEEDLMGLKCLEFVHPDDQSETLEKIKANLDRKPLVAFTNRLRTKDGHYKWINWTGNKGKDDNIYAIGSDYTEKMELIVEQRSAMGLLRKNDIRYNQAQAIAHLGNWELDFATNSAIWSDEACRIYGISPGNYRPSMEDWFRFIHPDDLKVVKIETQRAQDSLSDASFYHRIIRKDGTIRYVHSVSRFEFNKEGVPTGLYGVVHDVTEQKKLQEQLIEERLQKERSVLEASLQGQEIERVEIGKELHDNINQMLTTVKLYQEMALSDEKMSSGFILKGREILMSAIEEIRNLSKSLVASSFKEIVLIDSINDLISPIATSKKLKINFQHAGISENLPVKVKLALFRIVQEQLNNVVKHAAATRIDIKMKVEDDHILVTIRDDGKGFDPAKKKNGIGLSNIMSRTELLNGHVKIDSASNKGCRLTVTIPLPEMYQVK